MATSEQAAYMAAAIDGEGCITVQRRKTSQAEWRVSPQYGFLVQVTNTKRAWLEHLQGWFGGTIYQTNADTARKRACYILKFTAEPSRVLISQVMPYLLMKRRQAELLLEYFPLAAKRRAANSPGRSVSPDLIKAQEAIYNEIRELNRKGTSGRLTPGGMTPMGRMCTVDGCIAKHYGRGYCWIHYKKYIVRGGTALYERACEVCGMDFIARRSSTKCCSKTCSDKRYYATNTERVKAQVKAYKKRKTRR